MMHMIQSETTLFTINTKQAGPRLPHDFVSFCIDVILETHWQNFDFNSPLINTLANGLSPAYLRFSGTASDSTYYDINTVTDPKL